jgi:electron transfer flavoprotein beta subunit
MKAKKKPLAIKTLADIELDAAAVNQVKVTTVAMQPPPERTGGRIIEAESAQQKAAELARLLHEEAKVI